MADDAQQEFKILITSTADNTGFKEATSGAGELATATDKTSAASNKLKIDTGDLSDETKRQLGLVPELAHVTKESGEAAEVETLSRREQGKVLRELGNAAGFSGGALRELAYGPVGAGLALVGAYEAVKKSLEAVDEAAEKLNDEELAEHQASIKGLQTAWDDVQSSLSKYYAALNNAGGGDDPIKKQIDAIKAVADARIEASKRIQEELGREEIANLRASGASPEAIAAAEDRQRAILARLDAEKKNADGPAADEEELRRRQAADQGEFEAAQKAQWTAGQAKAREAATKRDQEQADALLDPTTEKGKALVKRQEQAAAGLETAQANREQSKAEGEYTVRDDKLVEEAQAQLDSVNAEIERAKKAKAAAATAHVKAQQEADDEETKSKNAQKISTENRDRITELPGKIATEHAVQTEADRGDQGVAILASKAGDLNASVGRLFIQTGRTHDETNRLLNAIIDGHLTQAQVVAALTAKLTAQQRQIDEMARGGAR